MKLSELQGRITYLLETFGDGEIGRIETLHDDGVIDTKKVGLKPVKVDINRYCVNGNVQGEGNILDGFQIFVD